VTGSRECGEEPPDSIKYGEFLDLLRNYQLLKNVSAVWSLVDVLCPHTVYFCFVITRNGVYVPVNRFFFVSETTCALCERVSVSRNPLNLINKNPAQMQ
jgi:hypothetical protein